MRIAILFVLGLSVSGCSNRALYDSMQMHERSKCSKVPPSEYQKCREATYKTYDAYEREYNDAKNH